MQRDKECGQLPLVHLLKFIDEKDQRRVSGPYRDPSVFQQYSKIHPKFATIG